MDTTVDKKMDELQAQVYQLEWLLEVDKKKLKQAREKLFEFCEAHNLHEYDFDESDECINCFTPYLVDPTDHLELG